MKVKAIVFLLLSLVIPSLALGYEFLVTYTANPKGNSITWGNIKIISKTKDLSDKDIKDIREIIQKEDNLKEDENIIIINIFPLAVRKSK